MSDERDAAQPRRRCECAEYAFVWVQGEYGPGWERERIGGSVLPGWCPAWCEACGTQLRSDGTCLTREEQAREWAVGHGWREPKRAKQPPQPPKYTCEECGVVGTGRQRNRRYCGATCRMRAWRRLARGDREQPVCRAKRNDGGVCRARAGASGFCTMHDPANAAMLTDARRRGGEGHARWHALSADEKMEELRLAVEHFDE